jgi:hypothetical protein
MAYLKLYMQNNQVLKFDLNEANTKNNLELARRRGR